MNRIPFSESLVELVDALSGVEGAVGVRHVTVDLPVEVAIATDTDDVVFQAHPRRWRLVTDFDERPGRLRLTYRSAPTAPMVSGGAR